MKTTHYTFLLMLLANVSIFAQQSPISNFYGLNEYLINPAEAGFQNRLQGSLSHRLQWQGIEGAPKTTFFGLHGAINEKMGIGGRITMDKTDILQQFSGALSYAYHIQINDKSKLHFGLSAQFLQNNIRLNDVIFKDEGDELLMGGNQEGMTFDAEAGMMLEWGNAKIGISSAHLFESGINYDLENRAGTFDRIRMFNTYASYLFEVTDKWNVEPFVLLRNQEVGSFQYEANAMLSWQQQLFLGAGYRSEAGIIARLGFQFNERIMAAYAYEFSSSGIASYSNGSHEFMLGYQLFQNKAKTKLPEPADLSQIKVKEEVPPKENTQKEVNAEELNDSVPSIEMEETPVEVIEEVEIPEVVKEEPAKKELEVPVPPAKKVEQKVTENKEPKPKSTSINKSLFEQKIPFEFERMNFSSGEKFRLDEIADELKDFPKQKVYITGHTCHMGSDKINLEISIQRAKAVKDYLMLQGVEKEQIIIKGMLDHEPLVPNNSLENRKKNRRVEFELVD